MTIATGLSVHPLSPTIGAEIWDIDLSKPLAPPVVAAVREALNTHHVIFFRDQSLTPEQQTNDKGLIEAVIQGTYVTGGSPRG